MTSNAMMGERRGRRTGMTVLGRVPKPVNLPSQRLENHGLDPNVEIVPKGTLGWGSKSATGTNAWGTSTLSPSTDGSNSSHSQLAGRPSSGGGSRPSTAGSEIAHDSNANAWSSNSRPSSASGSSTSNKVPLASLRPRSAETRPGSSQLSRFAEHSVETGAWVPGATSERVGLGDSGKDGFSLSSTDFPTLGSEKDESRLNAEPQDGIPENTDPKDGSWRKDDPTYEDRPKPNTERFSDEPHPYQNPNVAPHYESWRGGPPVNPTGPMWFTGPRGPPPYGPRGGFPMESFHYYPPHVPPSSHVGPPRGVGPHGHYPTNGDMYMPHMPESYMRPGMPVGPGFYPGPIPYGPSMGLHGPSDRVMPFMGMPIGPSVYNRPVNLNGPDPKHSYSRPGEFGPPDHADTCHPHDLHENSNVLRKQSDHWSQNQEKGILSKAPMHHNSWGDDVKKDADMHFDKNAPAEESHSHTDSSSIIENVDHSLIQKIEGLNAKARSTGGVHDGSDEQLDGVQFVNSKDNRYANDANSNIVLERHYPSGVLVPVDTSQEVTVPFVNTTSRKLAHGVQSRRNHGKVSFNRKEDDGWRKSSSESHAVVSPVGSVSNVKNQVVENHALYPSEVSESNVQKSEEECGVLSFDSSDTQRAKMQEIVKQRALQRQKEEEERIRDQKAKALAKLEELNRRRANQDTVPSHDAAPLKQDGPRNHMELRFGTAPSIIPTNEIFTGDTSDPTVMSVQTRVEIVKTTFTDSSSSQSQNQLPTSDVNADEKISTPVHEVSRQKRAGNKPRQNVTREKNSSLESTPVVRTDIEKDNTGKEQAESLVHQKKKNKNGKNKNKLEEGPTTVTNDPNITEECNVSNVTAVKDVTDTFENHAPLSHEDAHPRHNSWKPQHSRKPRSSQGNRSEKSHSNDAVVWAPVRPVKVEAVDQTVEKAVDESSAVSVTGDGVINNGTKVKRAEMERYVPKPVAKESVQKGNTQQHKVVSNSSKVGSSVDSKHVDGKHKQRGHGSHIETLNGSGKNVKSVETLARGPPSRSDHELPMKGPRVVASDGWNSPNDSEVSLSDAFSSGKDSVLPGREKRPSFKGHKGTENHVNSDGQTESTMVMGKESRAVVDRGTSQWKPKAQGSVAHNHQSPITEGTDKSIKTETGHSGPSDKVQFGTNEGTDVGGISSLGHYENKMDKSVCSVQGRVGPTEHRPFQRKANHSGRFNKGHVSRDWDPTGQENVQQRSNEQFEYQLVDSYNRYRSQPNERGAQTEMKFRGRGQSHARRGRGNFYGRQRGTHANAGYE